MPKTLRVSIGTPYDESPDVSWLDQTPKQLGSLEAAVANKRRRLAYDAGDWWLIGVRLEAEITLEGGGLLFLNSPGLWGVESDSSQEYLLDIVRDEVAPLRQDLAQLGFTAEEIDTAVDAALSSP
jgi:hypothetical protein